VRVDQSRQHRHLAQIDDACAGGLSLDLRERAHRLDALTFDQDADVGLDLLRAAIDETAGFDEHLLWRSLPGQHGSGREDREDSQSERAHNGSKRKRDGEVTPVPHP